MLDLPKENDMTKEEITEMAKQADFLDYDEAKLKEKNT